MGPFRLWELVTWLGPIGMLVLGTPLAEGADAQRQQQREALAEPFRGVTTDGRIVEGLFPIRATGVSTQPVREAAERFLEALAPAQRDRTMFPVDHLEWRTWYNVHRAAREGVSLRELDGAQRALAMGLLQASLSARGFATSRDIMHLNGYVAELLGKPDEYGDDLYFFTVMGVPSDTEPWGWQLDGHHLDINYFVLGDQVVMTPTFMGSEPVSASTGTHAGVAVLQEEQDRGLAFMQALGDDQQRRATISSQKDGNKALGQAFQDNLVLAYAGLRGSELEPAQRQRLLDLIALYVGNLPEGHARVRMDEVEARLDDTWFAWIGGTEPDGVFYYRIHSPVVLIEFDHQSPVALPGTRGVPTRQHVHTVVRTPNGNDYGSDLLRQHYERFRGDRAHGHARD